MEYDLNKIIGLCSEYGLKVNRPNENQVDITICNGCVLTFMNLVKEQDTLVGFVGTPWHTHGEVEFMTSSNTSISCSEIDIIIGLVSGELLIVSRYLESKLDDRWIIHKGNVLGLKYIEPGEELRIFRMA